MSTLRTSAIQSPSTTNGGISIDTSGHVTVDGVAMPSSGPFSNRNKIINGDMRIDQRNAGASVTLAAATATYTVDRFWGYEDTDGAMTAQQDSSAPSGFVKSLKLTTTTADASLGASQRVFLAQRIEGFNIVDLAWGTASAKTITLSFWVRSSLTGTFGGALENGSFNRSYPFTYSISTADTWEQKTVTIPGDTTGTWSSDNTTAIQVAFGLGVGTNNSGTAGSWAASNLQSATGAVSVIGTLNATWYITGVQLEAGSVATPFEHRSYGDELALCQRYCYVLPAHYHFLYKNSYYESQLYYFPVTMRSAPNITDNGFWVLRGFQASSDTTYSGFVYASYVDGFLLASSTTNNTTFYTWIHDSAKIIASAEL